MNYCPVNFGPVTDRQRAMHMSPPCKLHRWAQKLFLSGFFLLYLSICHAKCRVCVNYGGRKSVNYGGKRKICKFTDFWSTSVIYRFLVYLCILQIFYLSYLRNLHISLNINQSWFYFLLVKAKEFCELDCQCDNMNCLLRMMDDFEFLYSRFVNI